MIQVLPFFVFCNCCAIILQAFGPSFAASSNFRQSSVASSWVERDGPRQAIVRTLPEWFKASAPSRATRISACQVFSPVFSKAPSTIRALPISGGSAAAGFVLLRLAGDLDTLLGGEALLLRRDGDRYRSREWDRRLERERRDDLEELRGMGPRPRPQMNRNPGFLFEPKFSKQIHRKGITALSRTSDQSISI